MVSKLINRAYYLRRRPRGLCTPSDLEFVREDVQDLKPGQALVRTLYLSLDPTIRYWMSDHRGYMPAASVGAVMRGLGIGQVVESRRDDLPEGVIVAGLTGWQDYCVADDDVLEMPFTLMPEPLPASPAACLGVLGVTGGITAYIGMEIVKPKPGETVVVTGAAGSVGSIAGQIAKARGARVVGVAGGPQKCRHVTTDLGFDACVDYRADGWRAHLDAVTPDGVDVGFENVGGEVMDHVLLRLNLAARIALCGMISQYCYYNSTGAAPTWTPQYQLLQLVAQRASIHGFLVLDHADRYGEAIGYLLNLMAEGKLTHRETVVDGLENAIEAHNLLYTGGNIGKLVLRIAEPAP